MPTTDPQPITRIEAYIATAPRDFAGTEGGVYLGIAGREFGLRANPDDFHTGTAFTFVLGDGGNVVHADWNDPRNPRLTTADLDANPVYLRHDPYLDEPSAWCLERAIVTVNNGYADYDTLCLEAPGSVLWLSEYSGASVTLTRLPRPTPPE